MQLLGRNLEGLIGRAQDVMAEMADDYVSVEHLVVAYLDDSRFGSKALQGEGLDKKRLNEAIKQVSQP